MNISVFGLGYVGSVSAACLASEGHTVIGVDPNATKVDFVNRGQAPVIERDLDYLVAEAVATGRLCATVDSMEAVQGSEVSLICVGTPSVANGSLDLRHVDKVCREIGSALRDKNGWHVVAVRSTVLPGTTRLLVLPALRDGAGKALGDGYGVCVNPEFMREGTAVADYFQPARTVIGATDERSGESLHQLYAHLSGPVIMTDIAVAEAVKYVDNTWHALKVAFSNEVGAVCKAVGIDSHAVMDIFVKDSKLNISPAYLKPGFAFGGSCLPKDVRAISYMARDMDLDLPVISAILPSNQRRIDAAVRLILQKGRRRIGVLGLSFKEGTDDLRESPMVDVVERLLGKGLDIRIFDENVRLAGLVGANREYLLHHIPHISELLVPTVDDVLCHGEVLVVGNKDPRFAAAIERTRAEQVVVDLVRVGLGRVSGGNYEGTGW